MPELVPVRITSSGTDLPVQSAVISPDGKYLAYSDAKGVHVRSLQGAEARLLPNTTGMFASQWTADGTRVIITTAGLEHWYSISLTGDLLRDLGDWEPSPDGRYGLKFRNGTGLDIRRSTGEAYSISFDKQNSIVWSWSPGTKRLALGVGSSGKYWIEGIDLENWQRSTLLPPQPNFIFDVAWLSPSELMYALSDSQRVVSRNVNLWTLRLDPATGLPSGPPRQRTRWTDSSVSSLSATGDGTRVYFIRARSQSNVWLGDLDVNRTRLIGLRQLTIDDAAGIPLRVDARQQVRVCFGLTAMGTSGYINRTPTKTSPKL